MTLSAIICTEKVFIVSVIGPNPYFFLISQILKLFL